MYSEIVIAVRMDAEMYLGRLSFSLVCRLFVSITVEINWLSNLEDGSKIIKCKLLAQQGGSSRPYAKPEKAPSKSTA